MLHPMGLSSPATTVCPLGLHHVINRFGVDVFSATPAVWSALTATIPKGGLRGVRTHVSQEEPARSPPPMDCHWVH